MTCSGVAAACSDCGSSCMRTVKRMGVCQDKRCTWMLGVYNVQMAIPPPHICKGLQHTRVKARSISLVPTWYRCSLQGHSIVPSNTRVSIGLLRASELLSRLHGIRVQHVLEREQKSSRDDTLRDLGPDTCGMISLSSTTMQGDHVNVPPYRPVYPSSLMILRNVVSMSSLGPSLLATCILLLTVM